MQAVDLQGQMNEYFFDPKRKIPKAHLNTVCKKHQKGACRYISLTGVGYVCVKHTPMKKVLDQKAIAGDMTARGDNCEGLGEPL